MPTSHYSSESALTHTTKDGAMFSKAFALAAAIALGLGVGACATKNPADEQNMKMSAMDCKQSADSAQHEKKESASGPDSQRMKKGGCPMMAAKAGKLELPPPGDVAPSGKDPHADHRQ